MPRRPTIADVARTAGVATSTVSRALAGSSLIRPDTIQKVLEAATEVGYTPNRNARALSTGDTGVLGLIVPDLANPFFPPMVRAAQHAAEEHDMSVYVADSDNDPARELKLVSRIREQADGIILASSRLSEAALASICGEGDCVLINRDLRGARRILLPAGPALAEAIASRLATTPNASLVYVGGPHRSWSEKERRRAVMTTAGRFSRPVETLHCEEGTYDEARRMGSDLRIRPDTIVFGYDDVIAHGLFDAFAERGLRVPDDLFLMGCDGVLPVETSPSIPTIELDPAGAGRRAVHMLLDPPPGRKAETIPGRLRPASPRPAGARRLTASQRSAPAQP